MKFYTYISDAKVDMLFPQVPHDIKKKVATEFGVDLKFLSAKRKAESESEENRITRLNVVAEFIRKSEKVGSVDEPEDYIADTLGMRTILRGDLLYLSGDTEKTSFGMGGSIQHVIGSTTKSQGPMSIGLALFAGLRAFLKEKSPELTANNQFYDDFLHVGNWFRSSGQPIEKFEFLAKRLWYESQTWKDKEVRALLATPLYLAKAD